MATLGMWYCLILTFIKASAQCNTWIFDLSVTEQFQNGFLSFVTSTDTILQCSRHCSRHDCSIFSFQKMSGNCMGFHSFAAANFSSSVVEPIPSPVYHKGLDKVYITSGPMSLLVLKQKASYEMAKTLCSDVKGRLPIIDTDEKVLETLSIVGKMSATFWVGLSDIVTEDVWLWQDGTPLSILSTVSQNLNNYDGSVAGSDRYDADCAVLHRKQMRFRDNNCKSKYAVVCEKSP